MAAPPVNARTQPEHVLRRVAIRGVNHNLAAHNVCRGIAAETLVDLQDHAHAARNDNRLRPAEARQKPCFSNFIRVDIFP